MGFPNPFRLLASYALYRWAKWRGYATHTTTSEESERWSKCSGCVFLMEGDQICGRCNCLLFAKIPLTMEQCPEGFWKRIWRKKTNGS
jgi:hypothetical protein